MVEQYIRNLKKKYNINKKADLETILKEHGVDVNAPLENGNCLLHLMIMEEDLDGIKLLLNINGDYNT
jgi:hypothetical protein